MENIKKGRARQHYLASEERRNSHSEEQSKNPSAFREDGFEPLLDSVEAAALLKIHPKTLQKLAREGKISAIHIGKLWRFRASGLNDSLEKIVS